MKIYSKLLIILILFLSVFNITNWSFISEIFDDIWPRVHYCQNDECWISTWIIDVRNYIDPTMVTDQKASVYIQNVVIFLLGFIYLVAVILIIYAWFNLMTWIGDEEKIKKSKIMIIYVIIWIAIIFLANSIVSFVVKILQTGDII